RATGVALANGDEHSATLIVSGLDPRRTFLGLVGALNFGPEVANHARHIKMRGTGAKVNPALAEVPDFAGLERERAGLGSTISIAPSLDYLERAFDDSKYGRLSEKPFLECVIPTLADPSRAPTGRHVMSIWVQHAPYQLRAGNWGALKEQLGDRVID